MSSLIKKETTKHIIVEVLTFNSFSFTSKYGFGIILARSITIWAVSHLRLQTM